MFPFLAAGIVALASCNTPQKEVVKIAAINPANMDTTVAAGTDFYEYACGGWIKNNPLKPEYARFGTFDQLLENNQEQLRVLILALRPMRRAVSPGRSALCMRWDWIARS